MKTFWIKESKKEMGKIKELSTSYKHFVHKIMLIKLIFKKN